MADKKAAIDRDALENKPLNQLSAADFLAALTAAGPTGAQVLRTWPEKKKYELFLEPESLGSVTVGGILRGVGEKKKVELEKDPRSEIQVHKRVGEFEFIDPSQFVTIPAVRELIQDVVAREVAKQLKR